MAEDNIVQTPPTADSGAPTPVETGHGQPADAAPAQTPWYGELNARYGTKFENEEQVGEYWKQVHAPKQPEYPEEWVADFVAGVSQRQTPEERRAYVNEWAYVNGNDWEKAARDNPNDVIRAAMKVESPHLQDRVIDFRLKSKYKTSAEDYPDLDPADAELAALDAAATKREDAVRALQTLKGKSASLAPKKAEGSQQSPEEAYKGLVSEYKASAEALARSFKIDANGETYSLGEAEAAKASSPEALNEMLGTIFKDGKLSMEGVARLNVELQSYRTGLKSLMERASKKSVDDIITNRMNGVPDANGVQAPPADKAKEAMDRRYYQEKFGGGRRG